MNAVKTNRKVVKTCIRGRELSNLDPELFDLRIVEALGPCAECEFLDVCDTPCESVRELTPRTGELVELGHEDYGDEEKAIYYAILFENERKLIQVKEHKYHWTEIAYVSEEQVPVPILVALDRKVDLVRRR